MDENKTIRYKRGVWYVLEPGKDVLAFDTEEEAESYIVGKPSVKPSFFTEISPTKVVDEPRTEF